MLRYTIGFLLALLAALALAACGASSTNQPTIPVIQETLNLNSGDHWRVDISNCPPGSTTTLILNIDGVGPKGLRIRGIEEILQPGDEIVRSVDCGNEPIKYAFGIVTEIVGTSVTINTYQQPPKR